MSAAVFHGVSDGVKIENVPVPKIENHNDILVRIHRSGLCGSDIHWIEGKLPIDTPIILGHESSGEVADIGKDVKSLSVGDHITIDPNVKCGICEYCRTNRINLCKKNYGIGVNKNGGFAKYALVPEKTAYKIPDDMSWRQAGIVEPLSCVIHGLNRSKLKAGESVVVFGAGPMGMLWINLLKSVGAGKIISVELQESRRKVAGKLGADHLVDPAVVDPVEEIMRITQGNGVDVAVEMVGIIPTINQSIKSTRPGGRTVIMGAPHGDAVASFIPFDMWMGERDILPAFIHNGDFKSSIDVLHQGIVDADAIVTHDFPLNKFHEAFESFKAGEGVKTHLIPS